MKYFFYLLIFHNKIKHKKKHFELTPKKTEKTFNVVTFDIVILLPFVLECRVDQVLHCLMQRYLRS
jgi:hypothetical protein